MAKKSIFHLYFIILIVFASACNETIVNVQEFPEYLIDVNTGTQWEYVSLYDNVSIYFTSMLLIDTIFIFDGKPEKWYLYEDIPGGLFYHYFTQRNDGIYYLNSFDEPYLVYKYPPRLNDTYTTWYGDTITVLSISEKVKVKAGSFDNCIIYHFKNGENERDEIFKPGIGLIKFIKYKFENNRKSINYSYELSKFTKAMKKSS